MPDLSLSGKELAENRMNKNICPIREWQENDNRQKKGMEGWVDGLVGKVQASEPEFHFAAIA